MSDPVRPVEGGVTVRVRLTPSGGADRVEGVRTDSAGESHLHVRVRAAPEDGKANAALEQVLAKRVGAPKSAVEVVKGATARIKLVRIDGVDATTVRTRLGLEEEHA